MEKQNSLGKYADVTVAKAVIQNALPAMAAMLMVLIYNLADTFFVAQTNDALQVAAVSLATPVFLLFTGLGNIFGIGGTSVISRAMGEGRAEYAKKVSAFCMWGCGAVGVVLSAIMLIFMDEMLVLIGASADTVAFTRSYLSIVALSGPFVLIGNCYSNILRAEGQATRAMLGMVLGNLLNIILDPLMIIVFGWGISGAAIATVAGNVAAALYYIFYFLSGKSSLSISIKDFSLKDKICSGVLAIGIPASLGSVLMSVSQIIVNALMAGYGDMALAAMGVAMKVTMITGMLCIGIGQGVQPLLGYCVGAKTWDRYKSLLKFSLLFSLAISVCLTTVCYLFTNGLVSAFLTEITAFDYAVRFVRILLSTSVMFGVYYVLTNALQAMGAAGASLVINLSRQGIIYIPALFILNALMGVEGLVWAQPVADVLSMLLVLVLYLLTSKKMMRTESTAQAEILKLTAEEA